MRIIVIPFFDSHLLKLVIFTIRELDINHNVLKGIYSFHNAKFYKIFLVLMDNEKKVI